MATNHHSIESDPVQVAFYELAIMATPPDDPTASAEFWFRQGSDWQARVTAEKNFTPSKLETDPSAMLLLALERARNHWHSNLRLEHLLELAIDDPSHTLSIALKKMGSYAAFRTELLQFIGAIDKDNAGGIHEPIATPACLRVFDALTNGIVLELAIRQEELPNWARTLLETHLRVDPKQPTLL